MWKPRLVFWTAALGVGVTSVGFARLADLAQRTFSHATTVGQGNVLLPLVICPLGFAISAWLAIRLFPNSQGSGIPQAIAAQHLVNADDCSRLLSLRLAFGKIMLTVLGLLSGASIGREGPTVQVGASFMLAAARLGGIAQARSLILAGSAAGIAAAFNTPLAGIVFAIEEMSKSYESRANGVVLTAVILSGLAALGLAGGYNYFGASTVAPLHLVDWALVPVCGVAGGALGAAFSGMALHFAIRIRRWAHPSPVKRMVLLAGLCGFCVAVIGIVSGGQTFGTSYDQARSAVEGHATPLLFFLEKLIASFLSMMSGIPGGIFAPSLAIGAGLGSTVGSFIGA
ncbi:MAG: chloride channel protein, partial [Cypionkella sp.]